MTTATSWPIYSSSHREGLLGRRVHSCGPKKVYAIKGLLTYLRIKATATRLAKKVAAELTFRAQTGSGNRKRISHSKPGSRDSVDPSRAQTGSSFENSKIETSAIEEEWPNNYKIPSFPFPLPSINLQIPLYHPDLDIIESGSTYEAFGQEWSLKEILPTLETFGVTRLYDEKTGSSFRCIILFLTRVQKCNEIRTDRRTSLKELLSSILFTYLQLINTLLSGPPTLRPPSPPFPNEDEKGLDLEPQDSRLIKHIELCAINMHHLCNELRPVQVSLSALLLQKGIE